MRRFVALALASLAAAVACGIVAAVQHGNRRCGIEGVYFNRSEGAPAYAGVFEDCGTFSLADANLWLGAAVAFALIGVALLAATRLRRPPSLPSK